ncbi:MAG: hypothetical protein COA44_11195 [Arcobacter sp.]|nr:MAG: hypothetical protein COA44_11195 [Arcobacter sp.]
MAKNKKKVINLSEQNITFVENERHIKIISFNPNTMEVEVSISETGEKTKKVTKLPFAHLSKDIKKLIKPN